MHPLHRSTCHKSSEAETWHFHAEVSVPPKAIPDTSHSLPSTPTWGTTEPPATAWDTSLATSTSTCWQIKPGAVAGMKRGAAHDLETALTCRHPFWFTEVLSVSPPRSSLCCIANKQPCRLMEGDTKELWIPETYGAFTSSGHAPSHQIHTGTYNPLLPKKDRPTGTPSALGRSKREPFTLCWGLCPRQHIPPATSSGLSDTGVPESPRHSFHTQGTPGCEGGLCRRRLHTMPGTVDKGHK